MGKVNLNKTYLKQKSERMVWREGNSNYKRLLRGLGFKSTDTKYLKQWLSIRVNCSRNMLGEEYPVKICYDNLVGAFKTWGEACYRVALIERQKGNKL